jgi:membrane dipeptidase
MATHSVTRLTTLVAAAGLAAATPILMGRPAALGIQVPAGPEETALVARAKAIHDRVVTLDTHVDISPNQFQPGCNYTMRLTSQVNLPKMQEGGLDARS